MTIIGTFNQIRFVATTWSLYSRPKIVFVLYFNGYLVSLSPFSLHSLEGYYFQTQFPELLIKFL